MGLSTASHSPGNLAISLFACVWQASGRGHGQTAPVGNPGAQ